MLNTPTALLMMTLDAPRATATLRVTDGNMTADQRAALLRDVRGGKALSVLTIAAVVFTQSKRANRNNLRFDDPWLPSMATSAPGKAFLKNHAQGDISARGGTVKSATLTQLSDGSVGILATIDLVKPWAQEAALDGTMDRFSVGLHSRKGPRCSACQHSMLSRDCHHFPGLQADGTIVEAIYSDAEIIEVSAVNVPACDDTGIEGMRVALALHRSEIHGRADTELALTLAETRQWLRDCLANTEPPRPVISKLQRRINARLGLSTEAFLKHKATEEGS